MTTTDAPATVDLLGVARAALAAGLCPIPTALGVDKDGNPHKKPFGRWKEYQNRRPTDEELVEWFGPDGQYDGIGIVCGAVSGNLETLDLEGRFADRDRWRNEVMPALKRAGVGDIINTLAVGYSERTPSGGIHLPFRCETIDGSHPLAYVANPDYNPDDPESKRWLVGVETRGEGGFIVIAPTRGEYVLRFGGFASIPTLSPEDREAILQAFRSFDESGVGAITPADRKRAAEAALVDGVDPVDPADLDLPGNDFNVRAGWFDDVGLGDYFEYVGDLDGTVYLHRIHSSNEHSATLNYDGTGRLFVFTSTYEHILPSWRYLTKTQTWARINGYDIFNPDKRKADAAWSDAIAAIARMGYGKQYDPSRPSGLSDYITTSEPAAGVPIEGKSFERAAEDIAEGETRLQRWTMAELLDEPEHMEWLIKGVYPDPTYGSTGGSEKSFKSYVQQIFCVSLAAGVPAFGQFDVPHARPVVAYVGEGGRQMYTRRLRRIAQALGVDPRTLPLYLVPRAAAVDSGIFRRSLEADLKDIQPGLVVVDPWYMFHPSKSDSRNVMDEGGVLSTVSDVCMEAGATLSILHHYNRQDTAKGLRKLSMAGMAEWADSWVLIDKKSEDVNAGKFGLALDIGSRQAGGTRWLLELCVGSFDVDRGDFDGDLTWDLRRDGGTAGTRAERDETAKRVAAAILQVVADLGTVTKTEALKHVPGKTQTKDAEWQRAIDGHRIAKDREGAYRARWTLTERSTWVDPDAATRSFEDL